MTRRIVSLILLALLLVFAFGLFRHISREALDLPYASPITFPVKAAPTDQRVFLAQVDHGGHAIAPGGIHTKEKLLQYYPFMIDAQLLALDREVIAHVTYRKDGKVYWTISPKLIPVGTLVWYSSYGTALYACGNQVRYQISTDNPTSMNEPHDLYPPPVDPLLTAIDLKEVSTPGAVRGSIPVKSGGSITPTGGGPLGGGGGGSFDTPPISPVPEPPAALLMACGSGVIFLIRKFFS